MFLALMPHHNQNTKPTTGGVTIQGNPVQDTGGETGHTPPKG